MEGLAQTSGVLNFYTSKKYDDLYLTQVSEARFKKLVVPGDIVSFEVSLIKKRKTFGWFDGLVKVDGELAVSCKFSAYMN